MGQDLGGPPDPSRSQCHAGFHDRMASFHSADHQSEAGYAPSHASYATDFGARGRGGVGCGGGDGLGVTMPMGVGQPEPSSGLVDMRLRQSWDVGTVIEAFSASANRWHISRIINVTPDRGMGNGEKDVLVVQFMGDSGMKQKAMHRGDTQLAAFGAHSGNDAMPPGFSIQPSQSRPGQVVYFDATTGKKYASPELAWGLHFERLTSQPAGCETVFDGVGLPAGSVCGSRGPAGSNAPGSPQGRGGAMSLNDLAGLRGYGGGSAPSDDGQSSCGGYAPTIGYGQAAGGSNSKPQGGPSQSRSGEYGAQPRTRDAGRHGSLPKVEEDPSKVSLPSFNDARGSNQAAYLGYIGTSGAADDATEFTPAVRPQDARFQAAHQGGGPGVQPGRKPAAQLRTCGANPYMQAWQQDPFSEWRR